MEIPVPLGDVVDKITILRIKVARLEAPEARGAAARELEELESRWAAAGHPDVPEFEVLEAITIPTPTNLAFLEEQSVNTAHARRWQTLLSPGGVVDGLGHGRGFGRGIEPTEPAEQKGSNRLHRINPASCNTGKLSVKGLQCHE